MAKKQKYSIGQVLYVVLSSKNAVVPVLVVEEVTKKTIKGEEISYRVQPGSDPDKSAMLSELDGEIFETTKELQKKLLTRATEAVNMLVANAQKRAEAWFPANITASIPEPKIENEEPEETSSEEEENNVQKITLPDGRTATIRI
jgi:hypothetical protein